MLHSPRWLKKAKEMGDDAVEYGENMAKAAVGLDGMFEKMVPDYKNNMDRLIKVLNDRYQKAHMPFNQAMVWPKGMNGDLMTKMAPVIIDGLYR